MVREGGYKFKKGYSRSKGSSNESTCSSDEGAKKRAKISKEERERAIEDLKQLLKSLQDQLRVKEMRITKAKSINDFKVADQLMDEVRHLIKERTDCNKQLLALEKKSSKSAWYRKRAHSQSGAPKLQDGSSQLKPEESQKKIAKFFKGDKNVASTSTPITITDDVVREEKADETADGNARIDVHSPRSDDTLIPTDNSDQELPF